MKKNNMKNTKPLIAFFNAMIFFYLLAVFFHWDWDPENWGEVSRLAYVLLAPVISLGVYGYTSEIQDRTP